MGHQAITRRDLFRGGMGSEPVPDGIFPPWTDEAALQSSCTSCGACIAACPENILKADMASKPRVDFAGGECTFCGECARTCPEPVFDLTRSPPWQVKIAISPACLLSSGVTCQLCTDFCDAGALAFDMAARPAGAVRVDVNVCTGCGACLAACPVNAISAIDQQRSLTA